MYFVVFGTDKPGMQEVRIANRPTHREHLHNAGQHPVAVRVAGPTLTEDGAGMNGSLLIIEAEDVAAVRAFVADDPYSRAGLFQSVEIRPWNLTISNLSPA